MDSGRVITAQVGNHSPVEPSAGDHRVRFYDRDDELVAELTGAIIEALTRGEAFVLVATSAHRAAVEALLVARGLDLEASPYRALDATELLGTFMVGNHPQPALFESTVGALLDEVGAGGRPVQVYGEMVAVLWDQGDAAAAIELEELWNQLALTRSFSLLCGYSTRALEMSGLADASAACAAHTSVLPPASYAGTPKAPVVPGSLVLVPVPEAVPAARRFLMSLLPVDLGEEQRADAELMVSELATNAVRHASSAFRLSVKESDGVWRVTVQDADSAEPRERDAGPEDHGGRGVSIVGALADEWGYDLLGDGKAVWAEFAIR